MAKDYAEMLRKAREGYAAATSGDTSGASKSGAKDYAKMLQDARNKVQGIQSNNDADAAQRASNERTVAARYYTNNLQHPGTVKKTPEQQSNDRVVYARQPEVQQQLKEHVDKLRAGMEFKQTDEYKTGLQNRMSGASLSRSLAQNVPVVAPIKADETPVSNTAPTTEAREVYKEKQETPYLPGLRENSIAKQIGYLSEIAAAAVNLGAEDLKGGVKDLFNQITAGISKGTETKQVGKVSLPSGIKKSTKPTFRTYSENQELGLDDGSNLIKSMLKASEDAWYLNSDTEETPAEKRIAEIENKYKYTNKSDVTNFLASALSGTGYGTQNIAGSLVSGGGLGNPISASMTLFKGIRRNMRDAKRMGYSKDDAVSYATQQTLADTGLDAILNAAGAGVEQVAGKAIANIPSVYARAAARTGVSALSEAAQSALSNIVSVANQKMTGNPDATIDWNSVARSAAVGGFSGALQQGIIEIVNLPTNARLAKRDYAVAEEYIKRATHVESDAEAEQMVQVGKKLLEYVDDLANEGTSESKARAKGWKAYKDTISAVVDDLETYGDRIVVDFKEKSDIVNNIINAPKADIVDGTADLVNKVAESIEPNENAVNATIDYIRDEIQKKQNEITMQTDPVLRRETEIDRLAIIEIEKTLRNKRAEIESARKKKLEEAETAETQPNTPTPTAETEKTVETSEKPLTTEQKDATIPVENAAQEQPAAKQPKQEERVETSKNETTAKQTEPGNKNIQTFTVDGRTVEIDTSKRAPNEFTLNHVVKQNTKTGADMDVFRMTKSLSDKEYARLKKNIVGIGGYYSSFVKGFIVPHDKIDRISYFADVIEEQAPETPKPAEQPNAQTSTPTVQGSTKVEETATDNLPTEESVKTEEPVKAATNVQENATSVQTSQDQNKPASTQISDYVLDKLTNNGKITTQELQSIADKAHGGTMAEGKYDVKAMTDAMELGVNRYIIDTISNAQSDFNSPESKKAVESIDEITESILNAIPTQTKRSDEQVSLQQFSTPPNIAYLASWVANIDNKDTVLEPSAGIGGLASFAKADGATVYVNELSDSRLEMLKQLPFDGFFKENAEQINNILPDSVSPSVVLMNPPFSSTGGRTKNSTKNAIPHIEQALLRLQDGGRLVAIVGKGMADDTPTFRNWYNELRKKYNIRANIGIDGENYKKYGTTFDVQMLVIDKTGPQTGDTITGTYKDLHEIPKLLEGIRNDRTKIGENAIQNPEAIHDKAVEELEIAREASSKAETALDAVKKMHDMYWFAENESEMSRGKKYSVLSRPISKNASINRRDTVIKYLKKGAVPVEKSGEYRLQYADKTFAIVLKSEYEFAEYLSSNKRSDESWDDALKRIQYHDGALEKAEKAYNDARSLESQKREAAEEAYDALTKYRHAKWETAVRKSQDQNNEIKKGEDVNDRSRENQQLETGESSRKDVGIHRGADVPKKLGVADTIRENVSGHDSGVPLGVSEQGNSSGSGRIVADTENPKHAGIVQTDDGGSERGRSDTGIRERSTDAKGLHEEVSERGRGNMAVQRGDNAGHDIDGNGSTARRDKPRTRGDERLGRGDVAESAKQYHKAALDSSEDNGTYATYTPEKLNIKGAKPHPTKLVESSAMSSVHAPDLHYVPNLDRDIITKGVLSDAQLEAVMYAGQAHETALPNGDRKGFLIGDGTGVGKGREISGIILDNFNSGRAKAVWVSVSSGLVNDARRDWVDLGGKESDVIDFSKEKGKKGGIGKFDKGIMFVSYDTLKSGKKGGETNADIIADWFGKDFDGVIVFDEAHKAGNLIAEKTGRGSKKPSQNAIKANDFQNSLKNARVVYASATIADKVSGLAFVSRLGLWGDGTQFSGVDDFVGKIGGSGMAAMELVARDMKATGAYISRNLSYDGVGYERLEHTLTKDQIYMYDTMSEGWQVVMQDVDKAMRITGNKSKNADSQLWSSMMRFYDQVLVSMSMPSVISDIEKQLDDGKACVVQVVNTQEAAQERAVEKMRADGSEDYDNLDITPRQILEQYLLNSFPVEQYEKYVDENGNEQSRVARDSKGQPIINKEAVAMRDALLERIKDISIPEGPIDMLINHFGKDRVAEVSGRDRRFVNVTDENGNIKRVEDVRGDGEKNGSRAANDAEAKAFQNGEKDILIFSAQAGGTGYSYHADKRAKNSRQRVGYILQTAPNSQLLMQTLGRIHRSNEAFPPIYKLVSTDLSAQKRFVTSSARRLEQLGALTKGQRQASGGIFSADDNLETDLSSDALLAFFDRLGHGKIPGMDPKKILSKMGYTKYFYDEYGNFNLNKDTGSNVTRFLNRIFALGVEDGNRVFDEFMDIRQAYYEAAEEAGTLDTGMENVKADKLDIVQRETVYTDESTGAETQYVQAKVYNKPTVIQTLDDAMAYRPQFQGIRRMEDGSVRAVYRIADQTNSFGVPVKRFRLQGANTAVSNTMSEKNMNAKTEEIPKAEWEAVWKEAVKDVPEYNESELHMITGALLPVWNKLPQDGNIKAMRITATDGTQYLGRVIPPKQIDAVLRNLGASKSSIKKQYTGKELYSAVMDKAQAVSFDGLYGATWTVSRRRVSGENRLEVTGRNLFAFKEKYPGVFTETIQYKQRYFIPTGSKGKEILGKLAENGVRSVGNPEPDDVAYYSKTQGNWGSRSGKDGKLPMPKNISDIYKAAKEIFGIAINSGKVKNGAEGVYNTHANTIRTRVYGDLPTIAHELGHMFDKQYKLSDMESVNELVKNYKTDLKEAGYNESLYPKEAVAMYFADLLHDGEYAQQKNPQFSTALFDAMSDIDKNKLADFKQMTENYFRMDDKERRRAQVRYRYKDKSAMGKAKFQVESFLRDPKGYMGKISRDFMREVFDDVFELRYFDGAHTLAMRERQSDSIAKGRLEYAFTDNHGKVIGKSLKSVLYEGDITDLNKKDFEAYLIARVALDRLENNEKDPTAAYLVYADKDLGSKEALVNAILDYERENPTFADTANGVYEYRHNLLTVAVDSGIISKKLAERMEKQLPHYVPLYRYVEDKNNVSPLAKFKGSGRDIYSPIENLATQTAAITKAIQKNETRKALFNAIDTNEDMGLWAEKVPPDKFFDRVSTQEIPDKIMKFLQSGGNGAMTDDDMVEFTEELMKYIGGSVGMWKIKNKQNDKIVSVMRNGVPEYYEMHDPGLVKALENMNPHKSNAFISFMGTATRISSTLVTSVSPRFGLFTNPIRDFNTGYIFSKTTSNPVTYTVDWLKAFIEAVRNTDDFKAYVANGGGYVGSITSNANVLRGIYKDMVKPSSKLKESINPRNWLESLSGLANAIDSAPRFAEYKRALEKNGGDVIAAVQEGMDVTVNFRQSGRTTKEINNLVMFHSAKVTSIGQNAERILKNRRIFAKWLTVNFLKTAMHIAALVLFSKMFDEGDEDTLKDYQNLSTYNKFANWCYPIGDGQFLRVPKETNVMALSSVLDATWERFVLENPDAFKDMDEYLVDALMIADPNPMKAAGDLISDVTFFGTVLDLAKNETFTGAPIVPNGYQYRAAPEQYNEKTSALAIKLGSITGMSPFQIDYIIDDTTGFVGDVILNLTKQGGTTLKDAVGLKDTSKKSVLKGIPVPGVVLRDSVYSTDVVSNFYDTKEGYDKRSGSYDAVGEAGGKYSFYDTYGSYKYQKIADVYSKANARLKLEKNDEAKRLLRRAMNTFIQSANDTEKTKMDERISKLAENTGYTVSDIAPYIVVPDSVSGKMPDGVKVSYELDGYDLLDYYTMSQLYFQYYCNDIMNSTASDEEKAEALKKLKREVKEDLNDIFFEKLK